MAHALEPQDWSYRPPRKVRIGALKSALSLFAKEGRLIVVDDLEVSEIKTKAIAATLDDAAGRPEVARRRHGRQREAGEEPPQPGEPPVPAAGGGQRLRPPPARPPRRLEGRRQGARGALPSASPGRTDHAARADHPPADRPDGEVEPAPRRSATKVIFEVRREREQDPDQGRHPDALQGGRRRRQHADHARQGQAHGARLRKLRNWKKAIVTLKEGDEIQFFDEKRRSSHGYSDHSNRPPRRGVSTRSATSRRSRRTSPSARCWSSRAPPAAATTTAASRRASAAVVTSSATASSTSSATRSACRRTSRAIEYDPNRTARIALLHYADGEKRYILAPDGLAGGRRCSRARTRTSSPATA